MRSYNPEIKTDKNYRFDICYGDVVLAYVPKSKLKLIKANPKSIPNYEKKIELKDCVFLSDKEDLLPSKKYMQKLTSRLISRHSLQNISKNNICYIKTININKKTSKSTYGYDKL